MENLLDEFIDALIDLQEAKAARDKARKDCDGSWGYYGHYQEEELQKAKERFGAALDACLNRNRDDES